MECEDKEKKSSDCCQRLFYLQFFLIFDAHYKCDMQTGLSLQCSIRDLPLACYQGWLICFRVPGTSKYAGRRIWQRPANPWPITHSALHTIWVTLGGARDITHYFKLYFTPECMTTLPLLNYNVLVLLKLELKLENFILQGLWFRFSQKPA